MKIHGFFVVALCAWFASCTKDKTDYEAEIDGIVPEHHEFKETVAFEGEGYRIGIEALNGTLYKGYNEIRLRVTDTRTDKQVDASSATFLPMATRSDGSNGSCPHRDQLVYEPNEGYFSGYAVFTAESNSDAVWELRVDVTVNGQTHVLKGTVSVHPQPNKNLNMTTFTGNDGAQYVIALISPQKPKVAENELVAGIYRSDPSQLSFVEAAGYTLQLDPRMPEPSMGNHSSPNNQDLTQRDDGLYQGVVNYTMTGNWTLNFILLNAQGKILKGTEVSTDFTPGIEGAKSELFIDILF